MQKAIITILAIIVIGLLCTYESTYTRQVTVTKCENGIVYCIDKQGHIWSYEGNAVEGQEVILTMYDNHTSTITDDTIKEVKIK